jgi:hypothetical protein
MSAGIAFDRVTGQLEAHGFPVKLENVAAARAMCPAHGVKGKTSLRITAVEGRVLIHCFGGCDIAAVTNALGLTLRDLFDTPRGKTYDYADMNGTVVRQVHRRPDKSFAQSGDTSSNVLYRLPQVVEAVENGEPVYLVEGEQDADALATLGVVATTSPQGVDSWHKVDASPLFGAKVIAIPDDDEPGRKYARAIRDTLVGHADLTFRRAKVGKDAADHVAAGFGLDDFQPLDLDDLDGRLTIITASDVTIRRVRYLWEGRMPLGSMTLMPGEEGIGKTTIGVWVIAQTTLGTLDGELRGHPRDVLVLAPEDGIEDVFTPRLKEAGADLTRVHFVKARVAMDGSDRDVIVPRDLDVLSEAVVNYRAGLMWIDSLVTTLPEDLKSVSYKDVATALKKISTWAEYTGVAVAAPWHLNKTSGGDTAIRMMDSRGFRTAARSVLLVVADPEADEGVTQGIVAVDKSNASTIAVPALRYRIDSAAYRVEELDEETGEVREIPASCGVVTWLGEVEGDGRAIAREMLAPLIQHEGTAANWLRDYLEGEGEAARVDVIAEAEREGFSESSIKRAARSVVVSRFETGQDEHGRPFRRAIWSLPQPGHTHPIDPTGPTGEEFTDRGDTLEAGQTHSGQSGQSDEGGPAGKAPGPTEEQPELTPSLEDLCRDDPAVALVRNELGGVVIGTESP